jgi:hypothetical protein
MSKTLAILIPLAGIAALAGCARQNSTPRIPAAAAPAPLPKQPLPHEAELRTAVESFHNALASTDAENQSRALAAVKCKKSDIQKIFPKHERFWGVIELGLFGLEEDLAKVSAEVKGYGPVRSLRFVDLRETGEQWVVAKVSADVQVAQVIIECEHKKVSMDPLLYVNGRWVWFPNLAKIAAVLPKE